MNIDGLTVGEVKQIAQIANGIAPCGAKGNLETKRVVLVVDRGWIFAGDQSLTSDGYIRLTNAVHVFRWESIGFAKAIEDWKSAKVDIRKVSDVEVPQDAVVFRIPVDAGWGIK
jgi:hypothetical protein